MGRPEAKGEMWDFLQVHQKYCAWGWSQALPRSCLGTNGPRQTTRTSRSLLVGSAGFGEVPLSSSS